MTEFAALTALPFGFFGHLLRWELGFGGGVVTFMLIAVSITSRPCLLGKLKLGIK